MKTRRNVSHTRTTKSWIVPPTPTWYGAVGGAYAAPITGLCVFLALGINPRFVESSVLPGAFVGATTAGVRGPLAGLLMGMAVPGLVLISSSSPVDPRLYIYTIMGAMAGLAGTLAGNSIRKRVAAVVYDRVVRTIPEQGVGVRASRRP